MQLSPGNEAGIPSEGNRAELGNKTSDNRADLSPVPGKEEEAGLAMGFRSQCISDNTMANPMGILRHNLSRGCLGKGDLGWETKEAHKGPSSWRMSPSLQLICKFFREEPQPMHLQRCHKRRFFLRHPPVRSHLPHRQAPRANI